MGESVPASPPSPFFFCSPPPSFPPQGGKEGVGARAPCTQKPARGVRATEGGARLAEGRPAIGGPPRAEGRGGARGGGARLALARPPAPLGGGIAGSRLRLARRRFFLCFFSTLRRGEERARAEGYATPARCFFFFFSPSLVLRGGTVGTERGGLSPSARPSFFLLPSPVLCRRSPSAPVEAEGGKGERRPCLCKDRHVRHLTSPRINLNPSLPVHN